MCRSLAGPLEVLLCKGELNRRRAGFNCRLANRLGKRRRSTEVSSNARLELARSTREVLSRLNRRANVAIDRLPIRTTVHCARAEERQRIILCACIVDDDTPDGVLVELLRQVEVDAQKVGVHLRRLDLLEQRLEPTKAWCITADPEKLDAAERTEPASLLPVPNVLENARKRRDTDTSTDENGHLGLEDIFCGRTIGTIDADHWKWARGGCWIQLDEISTTSHASGILTVLLGGLHSCLSQASDDAGRSTNALSKSPREVTDLSDMDGHVRIFRGGRDRERMPLELGDFWALEEEPLAGGVLEAGLDDAEFHGARWVDENLAELGLATGANFTPDTLAKVDDTGPDKRAPRQVADANLGIIERERVRKAGFFGSTYEASDGVGVETDHEEECQVVSVPKGLEALLSDFVVRSAVHDDHDEQHGMTGDSRGLPVVDIERVSGTDLATLDIDKVDIVSGGVDHCPECHRISDLTMEPNVFVGGEQPGQLGTDEADNVSQHGDEDEEAIDREYETSTTRDPDGEPKRVQALETRVDVLAVPSIGKDSDVTGVPEDIKQETAGGEEFCFDPFL